MLSFLSLAGCLLAYAALRVSAFDNSRNDNLAVYWGQNSYGATHSDTANFQKTLSFYCQDNSIDAFPVAFLNVFFGAGGLPSIDLANICNVNDDSVFPGSQLPNCQFLASDIQTCQAKGKIVTISLGGATGAAGFSSDSQASAFADQIWNLFLGGSSSTRPFGNAVLDGVDLDIEGGSTAHFTTFVNQLRSHMNSASKKYYITAAPQCPFPDAYLGSVINAVGFDAIYVQFYNNYCGLQAFTNPNDWNFGTWDNWAKTVSPNRNVKIYIGAPASSTAAGSGSGYVALSSLTTAIQQTRSQYSSFGGVMMWDASQAYANGRFDAAVKAVLTNGAPPAPPPTSNPPPPPPTSTPPTTTAPPPTSGSCAGVNAWVSNVAYNGGDSVVYNGHLWVAKWWSYGDAPGGAAGDWQDDGACKTSNVHGPIVTPHYESKSVPLQVPVKTPAAAVAAKENADRNRSRFFKL
ncbi:Chitinase 1 [Steccherinum ochraceum]|uniref:chitinase n=1 Tax=Steccherinum ochraceum TaxID=92696 RepID=A0A4R0RNK5_9APHY|nr:Chitinase 1 [Steccherinum ochraceum]